MTVSGISLAHYSVSGHNLSMGCRHTPAIAIIIKLLSVWKFSGGVSVDHVSDYVRALYVKARHVNLYTRLLVLSQVIYENVPRVPKTIFEIFSKMSQLSVFTSEN